MLGCGMAGVVAARELRRLLPEHRIVAIDRSPRASYPPSYAALTIGEVRGRAILCQRDRLARKGIEFVNAEVHHIDLEEKQVRAESRALRYDYLVVALGSQSAPGGVPGLAESAQSFYSFEAAERLAASLRYFAGGRVLIAVPEGPIGWAAAPYELAMLLEHYFHVRRMRRKVEIAVHSPEPAPLAGLGAQVSELIAGQLAHKGIEFAGDQKLEAVEPGRHLAHFAGAADIKFDLLIALPPQSLPGVVVESGLSNDGHGISVDRLSLRTSANDVFAIGDLAGVKAADGLALAQSGELARQEAVLAARRIASRIAARPPRGGLGGEARWFVEVGAGAATMISGDFLAEPPDVRASEPSIVWHWAKTLREKYWLYKYW